MAGRRTRAWTVGRRQGGQVCRSRGVDPPRCRVRKELHRDRLCWGAGFIAEHVDVGPAGIDDSGPDRLVTDQAPWVPILNRGESVFVSARTGNYQEFPYYGGPLLHQMWVQ